MEEIGYTAKQANSGGYCVAGWAG